MNATTMQKMMFAAGLVLAACGDDLVEPANDAATDGAPGALTIVGDRVSVTESPVFDDRAPVIAMLPSLVHDERGDKIDFSSGEPVHTHVGPEIALSELECTAVYKYAYFMFASPPPFGAETMPNPLRYVFWIDDMRVDASFTAFRVRTPEDSVLRDWTTLAPISWHYVLPLYADEVHGVPELAKRSGKYLVDVRARDWAGHVSTATWCFELHLLASPEK